MTNENKAGNGPVVAGWVCFLLGVGILSWSAWGVLLYFPLFLASFILAIVALAQKRIGHGIALLLLSVVAPPAVLAVKAGQAALNVPTKSHAANATSTPASSGWELSAETSPIDDSQTVTVARRSQAPIKGLFGTTNTPSLVIRCKQGETAVYIVWGAFIAIDKADVLTRVDNAKATTASWTTSTDYKATFSPNGRAAAGAYWGAKTLLAQVTPHGESPVVATFDLAGIQLALEPLRKACKW